MPSKITIFEAGKVALDYTDRVIGARESAPWPLLD
jgi:hypothetical protein